jgi:hypothetical protein
MKRTVLALLLLFPLATRSQSFSVSFPKEASAAPIDGRLLLVLSTDPSDEPRNQIDDSPRTQIVFGTNVDGWQPGQPVTVDNSAFGYPIRSLAQVPVGDYFVQAVLNKYETFHRADGKVVKLHMDQGEGQHWNSSPGNLYSKVLKVHVAAGARPSRFHSPRSSPPSPRPPTQSTFAISAFRATSLPAFGAAPSSSPPSFSSPRASTTTPTPISRS